MRPHYLLVFDFDGTVVQTFEPSPHGMGVTEAYMESIGLIFGRKGLDIYEQIGGLQNRAPSELVHVLLSHDPDGELTNMASAFFLRERQRLVTCTPSYRGEPLEWSIADPEKTITEILVRQKLLYLINEVGARFPDGQAWPKPCEGFVDFWQTIRSIKLTDGCQLTTAVVSSGHETFIRRTFSEVLESQPPDILVTEDDIRWRRYPQEISRRVKPGQLQLALAHREWLDIQRPFDDGESLVDVARNSRARMIYFGDDPGKDGKMAETSGIPFGLFKADQSGIIAIGGCRFIFGDWREIGQKFLNSRHELIEGKPMTEVFLAQPTGTESFSISRSLER